MLSPEQIQIDEGTAKIVAQTICTEIKSSLTENKAIYDRAKKAENLYAQVTDYMAAKKVCDTPWEGAADYFIPLTEWTIDAVWSRALEALLTAEPFMTATGVANSDQITDFVDQVMRDKVKLYDNFNFYVKQTLKLPFAVLKYDWCAKYESKISKDNALSFANPTGEVKHVLPNNQNSQIEIAELTANGFVPQGPQEVYTVNDIELENQPKLKYIRFEDYVWTPKAKRDMRLYWEGDRFHQTISEMRESVKQERFRKAETDRVINALALAGEKASDKAVAARAELTECFHWFGRLPFNKQFKVDFQDPEAIEQEVYCVVAYKDEELLEIKAWPHSRVPYPERVYIRGGFEETEEFEFRSLVDKLYQSQKELNTFFNTLMNNAWLSMQKIFVKKKGLSGTEYDNPEVYPGAMWEEYQTGDIRVLEVGDVKSIGVEMQKFFLDFAERISNISIYQVGAARQGGGQKTLGEIQATITEGNRGMNKFIQARLNDLIKICKWTVSYYKDRMPPNIPRKVRDAQGNLVMPPQSAPGIFGGTGQFWEDRDLDGNPDFIWNGTQLSQSKEWQLAVANDIQDRYLNQPLVAQNLLATWEILKRGLVARGVRDWDKILPPRDAIINEMKVMAAQSTPLQPQPAGATNQPPNPKLVEAMRSKGVTPPAKKVA